MKFASMVVVALLVVFWVPSQGLADPEIRGTALVLETIRALSEASVQKGIVRDSSCDEKARKLKRALDRWNADYEEMFKRYSDCYVTNGDISCMSQASLQRFREFFERRALAQRMYGDCVSKPDQKLETSKNWSVCVAKTLDRFDGATRRQIVDLVDESVDPVMTARYTLYAVMVRNCGFPGYEEPFKALGLPESKGVSTAVYLKGLAFARLSSLVDALSDSKHQVMFIEPAKLGRRESAYVIRACTLRLLVVGLTGCPTEVVSDAARRCIERTGLFGLKLSDKPSNDPRFKDCNLN